MTHFLKEALFHSTPGFTCNINVINTNKRKCFPQTHNANFFTFIKLKKNPKHFTLFSIAIPTQETQLWCSALCELGRVTSTGSHKK